MATSCMSLSLVLALSAGAVPQEGPRPVNFEDDIQPILQQRCSECHGLEAREGGLRLTGRDNLFVGNDSGEPAIVAGDSAASELIRRVTADSDERMPPEGDPLTAEQIDTQKTQRCLLRPYEKGPQRPRYSPYPRCCSRLEMA